MSDTPRTDAEACYGWIGDEVCVPVEFSRQLERELTAAQAEALKLQERIETLENEKIELQKQLQQFGDNAFENALSLVNHRNQLQEENAKLQERIARLEEAGNYLDRAASKLAVTEISDLHDPDLMIPVDSVGEDYEITHDSPPTAGEYVALNTAIKSWRTAKDTK